MNLRHQLTALLLLICVCLPATALDDEHWKKASDAIDKGVAYLRTQQAEDGSWMPDMGPAVTGLALTALLNQPNVGPDDPTAKKAIAYILKHVQKDGSIRQGPDGILASYNTALSLSALAPVSNDPEVASAIKGGQEFLKGTQWIVGMKDPDGKVIDEKHPYFGGFGYGKHGRPDISNTQLALQALHDTGVDCEDPVFQRALSFLNRIQATEDNDLFKDKFEKLDGGFIYSTSVNKDAIGKPESKANQDQIDEAKAGREVSGLRSYGSVTYAGFKSMIYADLDRDDPRMVAAMDWISKNYTLDRNPGMPDKQKLQGLFYYYLTMGRALNAYGSSTITVKSGDTKEKRDWANDLVDTVVSQQHKEGWWANSETRWLESQPVLVTAYSIIALQNAID
ncbi:MAG: prenyltransferase/squalene oxidase repeat-containing protein [Phycisphaeraceae bacterium]|jgi:squalene-hopene/tetraprenyl-beta-curcumene cyclase